MLYYCSAHFPGCNMCFIRHFSCGERSKKQGSISFCKDPTWYLNLFILNVYEIINVLCLFTVLLL